MYYLPTYSDSDPSEFNWKSKVPCGFKAENLSKKSNCTTDTDKCLFRYLRSALDPSRACVGPDNSKVLGTLRPGAGRRVGELALDSGGDDPKDRGITSPNIFVTFCDKPDIRLALKLGTIDGGKVLAALD